MTIFQIVYDDILSDWWVQTLVVTNNSENDFTSGSVMAFIAASLLSSGKSTIPRNVVIENKFLIVANPLNICDRGLPSLI